MPLEAGMSWALRSQELQWEWAGAFPPSFREPGFSSHLSVTPSQANAPHSGNEGNPPRPLLPPARRKERREFGTYLCLTTKGS